MTLWIVLTVISLFIVMISIISSYVRKESLNDDDTLSAFLFTIGCIGTLLFELITILCI